MCYWLSVANPSRRGIAARTSRGRIWAEEIKPMATGTTLPNRRRHASTIPLEWGNEWHRPFGKTRRPRQPSESQRALGTRANRGRRAVRDASGKIAKPCRGAANLVMRSMARARTESAKSTSWPNQVALITRSRR